MTQKAFVFIGQQHVGELRVNLCRMQRQPPAPVRDRIGAQQIAMPVAYLNRSGRQERRQLRGVDPAVRSIARDRRDHQDRRKNKWPKALHCINP